MGIIQGLLVVDYVYISYIHTVTVKIKFPLRSSKTLQSRFHVGKKTFNDLKKWRLFITHRTFFYLTVVYFLIIYARLTICTENFFCSTHLLQGLALKQQLFCFSASSSPACLFLDAFRRSLLLLVAVVFTVVSLSVIRCRPSWPFHSLTSASFFSSATVP